MGTRMSLARPLAIAGVLTLALGAPLAAQGGWTASASGGVVSQLDAGSFAQASFSLGAAALARLNPVLSLGLEAGWDRHDVFEERLTGFTSDEGGFATECPAPCTLTPVVIDRRRVGAAWHVGPVLRLAPASGALAPFAELSLGLYGLRERTDFEGRETATGAVVPAHTFERTATHLAPGVGAAVGVDWFPGGGRLGVGVAARLRAAGRPIDDTFGGVVTGAVQARVTVR
jgi:hypothetical protein